MGGIEESQMQVNVKLEMICHDRVDFRFELMPYH